MNKLEELTFHIKKWNCNNITYLPIVKLVIIKDKIHEERIHNFLSSMKCWEGSLDKSFENKLFGEFYQTFKASNNEIEIIVIKSIEDEESIQDQQFILRRKIIEKLKNKSDNIFLYFSPSHYSSQQKIHRSLQHLELLCLDHTKNKEIIFHEATSFNLERQIINKYQIIYRFQIIQNVKIMKQKYKLGCKEIERFKEFMKVRSNEQNLMAYVFRMSNLLRKYLSSSMKGMYQSESVRDGLTIHWQAMEVMQQIWREEGQTLFKQLDSMPLSHIGEILKLSDHYSIGGFLADSCFKRLFLPLLLPLQRAILQAFQDIYDLLLQQYTQLYSYYFKYLPILTTLLQKEQTHLTNLYEKYKLQLHESLKSHLQYLYAPSEQFWSFRNIKTSLYSPEQQNNIEIKYIGKVYLKYIYDNIKNNIPRLIFYSFFRKVIEHISENSLLIIISTIKQYQNQSQQDINLEIPIFEVKQFQQKLQNLQILQKSIIYFEKKISVAYMIKDLYLKEERNWNRSYKRKNQVQHQKIKQDEFGNQSKGFFNWMKKLFRSKKQKKRSSSQTKQKDISEIKIIEKEDNVMKQQSKLLITDKNWLLIINTQNKKVDEFKLQTSCCYGFPNRMRGAIWLYLARRANEKLQKEQKLTQLLKTKELDGEIKRQIFKDLGRTPPEKLFRKGALTDSLKRVLEGYSLYDSQISYTQGMNFICGNILMVLTNYGQTNEYLMQNRINYGDVEEKAFVILKFLMMKQGVRKMMFIEREFIADLCFRLDSLIKELNENVWNMIQESGFTCEIIFASSIISLLATSHISYSLQKRVMDMILVFGFSVIYKIIAHFVSHSETKLSKLKNQHVYDYLRNKVYDDVYDFIGDQGLKLLFNGIHKI